MEHVTDLIYVGCEADIEEFQELHPDGMILHACKEPFHRQALGYTGRGAPKDHPEYLTARRGDALILNLIDGNDPKWIPAECFIKADAFIQEAMDNERHILIHCNQGMSRAPSILFYHLIKCDVDIFAGCDTFEDAREYFEENYYPAYDPANGVLGFVEGTFNASL